MRRLLIAFSLVALCQSLSGCALPDLIAHTVKAVEKSQRGDGGSVQASASPPPAARPAAEPEEPPPPQTAPMPRRSSVTAEELPPR